MSEFGYLLETHVRAVKLKTKYSSDSEILSMIVVEKENTFVIENTLNQNMMCIPSYLLRYEKTEGNFTLL